MKKIINGIILMAGVVAASQSAKAQFTANDLYLGFENASATSDYIVDLGQASTIVGGTSVVNLSDDFSLSNFNTVLGVSSDNVMGVVGGKVLFPSTYDVYATALRSGGPGNPAVAGSDLTVSLNLNNSAIAQSVASIAVINAPVAGTGVLDTSKSWSANIEPTFTSGTFYGNTGVNPGSAISGSGVLYEDLWEETASPTTGPGTPAYLGFFTLNLSGANPSLTFTPVAVPEPKVALISGIGFFLLLVRHRFSRSKKN